MHVQLMDEYAVCDNCNISHSEVTFGSFSQLEDHLMQHVRKGNYVSSIAFAYINRLLRDLGDDIVLCELDEYYSYQQFQLDIGVRRF